MTSPKSAMPSFVDRLFVATPSAEGLWAEAGAVGGAGGIVAGDGSGADADAVKPAETWMCVGIGGTDGTDGMAGTWEEEAAGTTTWDE